MTLEKATKTLCFSQITNLKIKIRIFKKDEFLRVFLIENFSNADIDFLFKKEETFYARLIDE